MASIGDAVPIIPDNPLDWIPNENLKKIILGGLIRIGKCSDLYDYFTTNPHPLITKEYFLKLLHENLANLQDSLKTPVLLPMMDRIVATESTSAQFDSRRRCEYSPEVLAEMFGTLSFEHQFILAGSIRLNQKLFSHEYFKQNPHPMIGQNVCKTSYIDEFEEIQYILKNIDSKSFHETMQRVITHIKNRS